MASQPSGPPPSATLFPPLESKPAPLDQTEKYREIIKIEKDLVNRIRQCIEAEQKQLHQANQPNDPNVASIIPTELITSGNAKPIKPVVEPIVRKIRELPTEEAEDEEEAADEEENEDEEQAVVEDEEDDAGGDYLVSHFDNGEGFEDNEDEGDDMNSMY